MVIYSANRKIERRISVMLSFTVSALFYSLTIWSISVGGCNARNKIDHRTPSPGGISMKKCFEYSKYVYSEQSGVALLARSQTRNVSQCHINAVPLVVGGESTHEKEFPHMVAIGYGKTKETAEWLCGGSLISEKFVLSAAHCSKSRDRGPAIFARLGTFDLKKSEDAQDFIIIQRIIHPRYKPPSRYHDIALFKLNGQIQVNAAVRPACLHTSRRELSMKKPIATGWGKLNYSDRKGSNKLMKVSIDMIDYNTCNKTFAADIGGRALKHGVINYQLCAGVMKGGKDTCQGDSGGPLQVILNRPYCMYEIIGVTSFGKFCGFRSSPAIYTRVSYYIKWIESVVWR